MKNVRTRSIASGKQRWFPTAPSTPPLYATHRREPSAAAFQFTTKAGKLRRRLGRPGADPKMLEAARRELANGTGVLKTVKLVGLGTGTVHRLKQSIAAAN